MLLLKVYLAKSNYLTFESLIKLCNKTKSLLLFFIPLFDYQ